MSVTNAALTPDAAKTPEATLREVVEHLAPIETAAGSEGEREAAEWIVERLAAAGATGQVDEETYLHGYMSTIGKLSALGAVAGLAGMTRRGRALGVAGGLAAAGLIADDVSNGIRPVRRPSRRERTTWNAVAETGDPDAERTIVVLAHHDAANTGRFFESTAPEAWSIASPASSSGIDTSLPMWWGSSPARAGGARRARRRRRPARARRRRWAPLGSAAMADIERARSSRAPTTT